MYSCTILSDETSWNIRTSTIPHLELVPPLLLPSDSFQSWSKICHSWIDTLPSPPGSRYLGVSRTFRRFDGQKDVTKDVKIT